jgi:hypothetical protein
VGTDYLRADAELARLPGIGLPGMSQGPPREKDINEEDFEENAFRYVIPSTINGFSPLTTLFIDIAFYQSEQGKQDESEKTLEGIKSDAREKVLSAFVYRILKQLGARIPASGEKTSEELKNLRTRQRDLAVRVSEKVADPFRRAELFLKIATVSLKRGYSGADKVFEKASVAAREAETTKKKADEAETAKEKADEGKKSDPSLFEVAEAASQYREMTKQLRDVRLKADLLAEQKRLEGLEAQPKTRIWVAICFCFTGLCTVLLLIGKTAIEESIKQIVENYFSTVRRVTGKPEDVSVPPAS